MDTLPPELLQYIGDYLDLTSIVNLHLVCNNFSAISIPNNLSSFRFDDKKEIFSINQHILTINIESIFGYINGDFLHEIYILLQDDNLVISKIKNIKCP